MSKLIKVSDLEVGITIDEELVDENTGATIIGKGVLLTHDLILRLENYNIQEVKVKREINTQYNEELNGRYENMRTKMVDVYNASIKGNEIPYDEFEEEAEALMGEVIKETDIIKQIRLLKERDDNLFNHGLNVGMLSGSLGKWLGFSDDKVKGLIIAGILHDLGKVEMPKELIYKEDLNLEEEELLRRHSFSGSRILSSIKGIDEDILMGVLQHHENFDGLGYPNRVEGERIHEYAKIINICNRYVNLTLERGNKVNPIEAWKILFEKSFSELDPQMTQIFLNKISNCYVGSQVLLTSGEIGEIIYVYPQDKTKAIIKVKDKYIDLMVDGDINIKDILN